MRGPGARRAGLPLVAAALALAAAPARAARPIFPEVAPPESFGRVVLDRATAQAKVPPVTFEHWRHRAMFTCRLCHIDVGFAMRARDSEISRATNAAGLHCGACHDGEKMYLAKPIFPACSASGPFEAACSRCHAEGDQARRRGDYFAFVEKLPLYAGGYVAWDEAEARGRVLPLDQLEGVSIPRQALRIDKDVPLEGKGTWLGEVTFSHRKHSAWNGCEVCHPEIFPITRSGRVRFEMADLRAGRYCGVCHRSVAFPLAHCQRCHRRSVGD